MQKYHLFNYEQQTLYGDNLQDALERQETLTTPKRYRRANTANPETYGGETLTIARVLEIHPPDPNHTRDNRPFERAVVELVGGQIIEVDAYEVQDRGRPTFGDQPMRQSSIWLPQEMLDWLKAQPGGVSETIRELIRVEMDRGAN